MSASKPVVPFESAVSAWFTRELLPHEPALRAYLRSRFPSLSDQADIVQESYARLLRAHATQEIRCPRALLFTTARNLALDFLRHQQVLPMQPVTDSVGQSVVIEDAGAHDLIDRSREHEVLAEALHALPERCREVVLLRYRQGLSYKEIAVQLGISPETVKVHLAKGLRRCTDYFADRGLTGPAPS
jgi:RNA polymerase sigma factor (sigma-70 family)